MRPVFHCTKMLRLGIALVFRCAFMCLERLVKLLCALLPNCALLSEFCQLPGLLLHETLDVRQSRFSDPSGLIRTLCHSLGFGDRDFPDLAFLRE